jgi:lipoprotein NlpD
LLITGCSQNWLAPSSNLSGGNYTVRSGDTLNSIARKFKANPQSIADYNNLKPPYRLRAGQSLMIRGLKSNDLPPAVAEPVDEPAPVTASPNVTVNSAANNSAPAPIIASGQATPPTSSSNQVDGIAWSWPTKGNLISPGLNGMQKGIDIAGTAGQPIYAAASGQVIFSGVGSSGYGNMIIIKHPNNYLSAYGNNQKLMVKEGQLVSRGQQIATMGQNQQITEVHFEIRKAGTALDPLNYLPKQ